MDVLLQNIKSKKHKIPDEILEALFIEGLYASFGVIITAAERNAFDSFVKNLTGFSLVDRDENNLVGLRKYLYVLNHVKRRHELRVSYSFKF